MRSSRDAGPAVPSVDAATLCTPCGRRLLAHDHVREGRCGQDLDPVTVRVLDEGETLHLAVVGPLHECDAMRIKVLGSGIDVRHCDADMAKTARFGIAVVISGEVAVGFGAPVMGQLERGFLAKHELGALRGIARNLFVHGPDEGHEIQRKPHVRKIELVQQRHPEDVAVEGYRTLGILDAQHRLIEDEVASSIRVIRAGHVSSLPWRYPRGLVQAQRASHQLQSVIPPSTISCVPVMKRLSSDKRNSAALAISSGSCGQPSGTFASNIAPAWSAPKLFSRPTRSMIPFIICVRTIPGCKELQRMP